MRIESSCIVNYSIEEAYKDWTNLELLPDFSSTVVSSERMSQTNVKLSFKLKNAIIVCDLHLVELEYKRKLKWTSDELSMEFTFRDLNDRVEVLLITKSDHRINIGEILNDWKLWIE